MSGRPTHSRVGIMRRTPLGARNGHQMREHLPRLSRQTLPRRHWILTVQVAGSRSGRHWPMSVPIPSPLHHCRDGRWVVARSFRYRRRVVIDCKSGMLTSQSSANASPAALMSPSPPPSPHRQHHRLIPPVPLQPVFPLGKGLCSRVRCHQYHEKVSSSIPTCYSTSCRATVI